MSARRTVSSALLFAVATVLGLSSTIQAYQLQMLTQGMCPPWLLVRLLVLNLVYWYVPALLAPAIMALTRRYRLGHTRWTKMLVVHLAAAIAYSIVHTAAILATRAVVFEAGGRVSASISWLSYAQRQYLMQLDWLLVTYFLIVGLAHALEYWRESEERAVNAAQLQTRLVEAQLQALQRQLHPHFLFNTLHTISGLMRQDPDAADVMIDRLSDLLRMTLHTSGVQEVTLKEELEILQKYLEIEQTRFRDRLSIAMDIQPGTLDACVPNLLLQPLVENAIRHGIAPRARPGRVDIRASRAGQQLHLEVRDSGDGVPPDRLLALNRGVGLGNTRARLEHLYGSGYRFVFSNVEGGGFCVTVTLPFHVDAGSADVLRAGVA